MRRAVARGRMFPQSYSTDRRYGRLTIKAIGLFPLMWANADDQGRLCGDSEEIKYAVCPNIDHITKLDIPELLKELQKNELILCYDAPKSAAIQLLDWWTANQKMQWAWPSDYPPPQGWQDHLRYKKDAKTVFTQNWPPSGEHSGEDTAVAHLNDKDTSAEGLPERSGENSSGTPLTTPVIKNKREGKRGRGRGNSPEGSAEERPPPSGTGEKPTSPSPDSLNTDLHEILDALLFAFRNEWGRVPAEFPDKIIPREPNPRERAQIRDLATELVRVGGCPLNYITAAFREAAGQENKSKMRVSYVRAILLDWLGVARERAP